MLTVRLSQPVAPIMPVVVIPNMEKHLEQTDKQRVEFVLLTPNVAFVQNFKFCRGGFTDYLDFLTGIVIQPAHTEFCIQ